MSSKTPCSLAAPQNPNTVLNQFTNAIKHAVVPDTKGQAPQKSGTFKWLGVQNGDSFWSSRRKTAQGNATGIFDALFSTQKTERQRRDAIRLHLPSTQCRDTDQYDTLKGARLCANLLIETNLLVAALGALRNKLNQLPSSPTQQEIADIQSTLRALQAAVKGHPDDVQHFRRSYLSWHIHHEHLPNLRKLPIARYVHGTEVHSKRPNGGLLTNALGAEVTDLERALTNLQSRATVPTPPRPRPDTTTSGMGFSFQFLLSCCAKDDAA